MRKICLLCLAISSFLVNRTLAGEKFIATKEVNIVEGFTGFALRSDEIGVNRIVGYYNNSAYVQIYLGKERIILKKNIDSTSTKSYTFLRVNEGLKNRQIYYTYLDTIGGVLNVFYSKDDDDKSKITIYKRTFNANDLTSNNDDKEFLVINEKEKISNTRFLELDGKLIISHYSDWDPKEKEHVGVWVYDNKLNLITGKDTILRYQDDLCEHAAFRYVKSGNLYILEKVYRTRPYFERVDFADYYYSIICLNNPEVKEAILDLKGKIVKGIHIEEVGNNIVCAGTYSETDIKNAKGCFYAKFNKLDGALILNSLMPFSDEVFTQGLESSHYDNFVENYKSKKGKPAEFRSYDHDYTKFDSKGNAYVIGRIRKYTASENKAGDGSFMLYDFVISRITNTGKLSWHYKLIHRAYCSSSSLSTCESDIRIKDDELVLYLNDSKENNTIGNQEEDRKIYVSGRPADFNAYTFNSEGFKNKKLLHAYECNKKDPFLPRNEQTLEIPNNSFLQLSIWNKTKIRLGILTLED